MEGNKMLLCIYEIGEIDIIVCFFSSQETEVNVKVHMANKRSSLV